MSDKTPQNRWFALLAATALLFLLMQLGLVRVAFGRLGLSAGSAMALLSCSLLGSAVNLPLFRLRSRVLPGVSLLPPPLQLLSRMRRWESVGRITIALNVGGGLVPILFSLYLLRLNALPYPETVIAVLGVATVSYAVSRPVPGMGIGMPILVAPVCAALLAVVINPAQSAPLAYVCGSLGVLIGADLLRLKDVTRLGTPFAAIGGAGTFDGIFLSGFIAVLLA